MNKGQKLNTMAFFQAFSGPGLKRLYDSQGKFTISSQWAALAD